MKKPNIHKGKWIACYDVPAATIEGHIIKADNAAKTPIASLWVGGGTHGKPIQRATTKAIASVPDLLRVLERIIEQSEVMGQSLHVPHFFRDLEKHARKALIKAGYTFDDPATPSPGTRRIQEPGE